MYTISILPIPPADQLARSHPRANLALLFTVAERVWERRLAAGNVSVWAEKLLSFHPTTIL